MHDVIRGFCRLSGNACNGSFVRKMHQLFRAVLGSEKIAVETANCFVLSVCLLVTWITVLQACVDVLNGEPIGGLLGVFAFYIALAFLLFNRLRRSRVGGAI